MYFIIVTIAGASLTVLLLADYLKCSRLSALFKVITSGLLVSYSLVLYTQQKSYYALLIVVAIILGAIGDVCLISKRKQWFMAGLIAFLIGHLIFVTAFLQFDINLDECLAGFIGISIAMYFVYKHIKGEINSHVMRFSLVFYMVVIAAMTAVALSIRIDGRHTLIGLGAILFLLSDYFVAINQFKHSNFYNRAIGLPLYYTAQFILATTIIVLQTNNRWLPV